MSQEIKIWAQMFFDDGTVTQGVRIPAQWLEEKFSNHIDELAQMFLKSTNREEGHLLMWGAGNMIFRHYPTSFSKKVEASRI